LEWDGPCAASETTKLSREMTSGGGKCFRVETTFPGQKKKRKKTFMGVLVEKCV